MKPWEFGAGTVVKWSGKHWIVVDSGPKTVRMVSASSNRVSACVSDKWPDDPTHRLESIEYVACSVEDYIRKQLFEIFPICKERIG